MRRRSGRLATPAAAHQDWASAVAGVASTVPAVSAPTSGVAAPRSPRTCWRESWLSIAHLRRAGLISMPSRSSRSSARKPATSLERLALDLVGQEAGARLADGAAATGEPDPIHDAVGHAEHQGDAVTAQRVGAFVRGVGILDDPEVVGPSVVLEDVVAVEVVHSTSDYIANVQSLPPRSGLTDRCAGRVVGGRPSPPARPAARPAARVRVASDARIAGGSRRRVPIRADAVHPVPHRLHGKGRDPAVGSPDAAFAAPDAAGPAHSTRSAPSACIRCTPLRQTAHPMPHRRHGGSNGPQGRASRRPGATPQRTLACRRWYQAPAVHGGTTALSSERWQPW